MEVQPKCKAEPVDDGGSSMSHHRPWRRQQRCRLVIAPAWSRAPSLVNLCGVRKNPAEVPS